MKTRRQYRQGDLLIELVDSIPIQARVIPREHDLIEVKTGEHTGHRHLIADAGADLLTAFEVERYLRITVEARLTHPEHASIALPAGLYRVVRQREYDPMGSGPASD